ncbi:hypothetical protein [Rhodanobacter sp. C05]|uniref:hypothetical protein n=1 Tax=Rhodanobacter sp. C05 TaxID=1945855 RepID=UPI0009852782|nr:hypothetical protein [Rhodanobacter sp. C05]OOG37524.1 hypothetical protein B0E51_16915 [Rhodanobacter sp. C05]
MPVKNLEKAADANIRSAYEQDYKTAAEKKDHIHRQVYGLVNQTQIITGVAYPVIDLSILKTKAPTYGNVVQFLIKSFKAAGVRPDTPFHMNLESKYPVDVVNTYRYVEYNVIGGGMRLIYDATSTNLFLSAHYSDPALLIASSEDSEEQLELNDIMTSLRITQKHLVGHSEGTYFDGSYDDRLVSYAQTDPAFRGWLLNKNSAQATATLEKYGLR